MNTQQVLDRATDHIVSLQGHEFRVLSVTKPVSPTAALNLAKVISKLSPLVGNMIEFNTVELLNDQPEFQAQGEWRRQDPDFPDTVFVGDVEPEPGLEIKAWFPLATEITARFRDSQNFFANNNIRVALLAWLPEYLIYGKPSILAACVVSALSIARARDGHYHQPPDYLVLEPENTEERTRNLQQSNTAGYKWQGTPTEFEEAMRIVEGWGDGGISYKPTDEYQERLRDLTNRFKYRLDTNFAKLDRIVHPEIEAFKSRVYGLMLRGMTVGQWNRLLNGRNEGAICAALEINLGITEADAEELIE